jgi:transposase
MEEGCQLIEETGMSVGQVCRELDLTETAVRRWHQQCLADKGRGPSGMQTSEEKQELKRLRKEVRELRGEREVPNRAAAFFANESL